MNVQPVERVTLSDSVAAEIRRQIDSGDLRAGDSLPPERVLSQAFGVGRTTVREAIRGLLLTGFLQRKGTKLVLATPKSSSLLAIDVDVLAAHISIEEVFETRRLIESECARLAAERATAGDLARIQQARDAMLGAEPRDFSDYDMAFHVAVVRAARNQVLAEFYESGKHLFFKTPHFYSFYSRSTNETVVRRTVDQAKRWHCKVFEAIQAHDPTAAAAAMRSHLARVERGLLQMR